MAYREVGDGRGYPLQGQAIEDNFIELFSDQWDDLTFPASAINPAGTVAPPTVDDSLDGVSGTLLFSGSAVNAIAVVAQMKHGWKRGSSVRPHIHWEKTTESADAVTWELYYRHIGNPGDTKGAWVGPVSPTATIGDPTADGEQLLTYWPLVDMTGFIESAMTCYRIHRKGDTDAYSGTARLYEFDVHYQSDKRGTPSEVPE